MDDSTSAIGSNDLKDNHEPRCRGKQLLRTILLTT